ncbi:bifunctional serine/threonine-protein kinase/formylglycine-generating enzyme family protein [Agarilytica rhodophyticola]|uniref:bifunctional serine/threonine-protein kinase/formylglycine-generating enzyme family protein n=1 Tax=Agarilytica rhodophyticola TaxID=1737490 RepID=UPI000B3499F0|nr:bifunctional serine/threonine-protein kinase/formylglycine-generating enzyme family protein [Agarilytica rhodophyticola]
MTESNDNDKTRVKLSSDSLSDTSAANTDDKTRISPRSNGANNAKGAQASNNSSNAQSKDAELLRRQAAQKKARELEKRLASIAAKKTNPLQEEPLAQYKEPSAQHNTLQAEQGVGDSQADDRTRFDNRRAGAQQASQPINPAGVPPLESPLPIEGAFTSQNPDDSKTRIAPLNSARALESSDGTSEASASANLASPENVAAAFADNQDNSKTQFKPIKSQPAKTKMDATKVVDGEHTVATSPSEFLPHESSPITGGFVPVDRKQYTDSGQELLKGRFVLESVLGAGGMGVVYKAQDLLKIEAQDRDPYVAIKVLGDDFKSHPEAFIALQRESRKTQKIAHPNIVNVHDFDRDGDNVFMTMEFLEGKPLDKLISQYKSTGLPEDDAWQILEGISKALIYAHEQRIIHSDFKPGNIFVTNKGLAKVFDFGIARAVAKAEQFEESVDDKTVFDAGNLGALTPAYASLEMLEGKTPDVRDDIYALGCIAYEMFTGNHPFNRVHANDAKEQKLKPARIPNISKRQWRAIEKALAFERENRVDSVEEFWTELTQKRKSSFLIASVSAVLLVVTSLLVYQIIKDPKDPPSIDINLIEIEFKVDANKEVVEEALTSLEFTKNWEQRLWKAFSELGKLIEQLKVITGDNAQQVSWHLEHKEKIGLAYSNKIQELIQEENIPRAREIYANISRYIDDEKMLVMILERIDNAEQLIAKREEDEAKRVQNEKNKRLNLKKEKDKQKQNSEAFDKAMATVNKQVSCRSSMNMRDIDIAVSELRRLDRSRYNKVEGEIVNRLSSCIARTGRSFPERAQELKKRALRIFPNNATVAGIKIIPKDPCDLSLAGLGAKGKRAICRDSLKSEGTNLGSGPSMVVVPAKGSIKAFAISKYEVTVYAVNKFCAKSSKCEERTDLDSKNPRTDIDAKTIRDYLSWLSRTSKHKYRLPTKAEWIYAARSNSSKRDSNRNCRLDSRGIKKGGVLIKATSGQQNAWGLVNALGNARELVRDGGGYAAMGGSYETAMEDCVVTKSESTQGKADALTGFRILREIDNTKKN